MESITPQKLEALIQKRKAAQHGMGELVGEVRLQRQFVIERSHLESTNLNQIITFITSAADVVHAIANENGLKAYIGSHVGVLGNAIAHGVKVVEGDGWINVYLDIYYFKPEETDGKSDP